MALTRALAVITGGPGTGKTTTVARLLVLLLEDARARGLSPLISLAAPTGKAAARAADALLRERNTLRARELVDPALEARLPQVATTLHRLLGARPDGGFRHGHRHLLPADIVVVDECSMVDLRMFDALLDALKPDARLILLGDSEQLEAVEAGNVFGALCEGAGMVSPRRAEELAALGLAAPGVTAGASPVHDATAVLRRSYRFDAAGGIGRLAAAVQAGDLHAAESALATHDGGVEVCAYLPAREPVFAGLAAGFRPLLEALAAGAPDAQLLDLLESYRVLCALREGSYGVEGLNRAIEHELVEAALLPVARGAVGVGRPLLVSRNDYGLRLFNGDLGIVVRGSDGREEVLFRSPQGPPRRLPPGRLPQHEMAFAMTIHKSQGSESGQVAIVLPPPEVAAEFGGREMLYTAITRARDSLVLALPEGKLERRWLQSAARASGLAGRLHGSPR